MPSKPCPPPSPCSPLLRVVNMLAFHPLPSSFPHVYLFFRVEVRMLGRCCKCICYFFSRYISLIPHSSQHSLLSSSLFSFRLCSRCNSSDSFKCVTKSVAVKPITRVRTAELTYYIYIHLKSLFSFPESGLLDTLAYQLVFPCLCEKLHTTILLNSTKGP